MRDCIKVSVIMPVYNGEVYLERALKDVCEQTLKEIEIICVDDGSEDGSKEIIQDLQKKDSRIVLIEQENHFAGAARNNGLNQAHGKYIVFWDSDDMFQKDALYRLYRQMERTLADICVCGARRFDNTTGQYITTNAYLKKNYLPKKNIFNKEDIPKYIFNFATNVPWNKMFLRSFIVENQLRFQEIKQANDTYFMLKAFFVARKITSVDRELITYRVNNRMSLSGKASDTVLCAYESYCHTWEDLSGYPDFKIVKQSFQNRVIDGLYHSLNIQSIFSSYKKLYEKIKQEGIAKFDLEELKKEDYQKKWMYDDLQKMKVLDAEEFVLQKSISRRLEVERLKSQKKTGVIRKIYNKIFK